MLPDEEQARALMDQRFGKLLRASRALHDFAVRPLLAGALQGTTHRGLDRLVVVTAVGLYVRALKQHRSIQLLAERGLGQEALSISRNFFETTLAIAFLLRHRITLEQGGKKLAAVPGLPLTTRFRTRLFYANAAFEEERTKREFQRTKGLKRWTRKRDLVTATKVARYEQLIGPDWSKRLKSSKSLSGVSTKDLALSLGLARAYATHYRVGSWATHPTLLSRYVTFDDGGGPATLSLSPNESDVSEALAMANVLLKACLEFLNDRFGLGLDAEIAEQKRELDSL